MVQFIDLWRGHPTNEAVEVPCLGLPVMPSAAAAAQNAPIAPRNPSATLLGIALRRAGIRIESFPPRIATCSAHDRAEMHFLYPRQIAESFRKFRLPGVGETELNRLFYRLGWTKGWYKGDLREKVFGQIASDTTKPDWKTIKNKLTEMARKYDRAA